MLSASSGYAAEPQLCYQATHSDVTYAQVLELPTDEPDEVLNYGELALQFGELWLPKLGVDAESSMRAPLVILLHGGCWLNQFSVQHTHALSTALANSGYAVWAPEYRRSGDKGGGWPGSLQDVEQAIDFILAREIDLVDTSRVALIGHSAGGHLALLAGADRADSLAAVIGLAAIVDIEQYAQGTNSCETATAAFMGGSATERPEQYQAANPINIELHPNTILLHGSKDAIVDIEQAQNFPQRLVLVDGAGHFDMIHSATPSFQQLLKQLAKALP